MDYNGLTLTPSIFKEILIKLFDGKQFKRQDAICCVKQYFAENGGILESKDYVAVFKKASKSLEKNGMVHRGYGTWAITYKEADIQVISPTRNVQENYVADRELGVGDSAVYVYYYDAYRKLAQVQNLQIWECKIGRSDSNPIQRVFNQAGTCYPELPHLALIIHCSDSVKLESALHSILQLKNRWLENAPGNEWFLTSPEEIEAIYSALLEWPPKYVQ
ncbi:MAG: GIY-YIG nuclease family protein [Oscillospiraceae bacterium]